MIEMTPVATEDRATWNERMVAQNDPENYLFNSRRIVRWIEAQRVRSVCKLLQSQSDCSVLEVGCGSGHILATVNGREKHGVDLSRRMIARAQEVVPDGWFRLASADDLPYRNGTFDRVFCTSVLSHVPNPRDVLSEAYRVVRPGGGRLVVTVSNEEFINWGLRMAQRLRLYGILLGNQSHAKSDQAFEPSYHIQQFDRDRFQEVIEGLPAPECIRLVPSRLCPVHIIAAWQR